jgi:hypothetical protein
MEEGLVESETGDLGNEADKSFLQNAGNRDGEKLPIKHSIGNLL